MNVEKFSAQKSEKLTKSISRSFPAISYNEIQKMLRNRDVKVNGVRVSQDINIEVGDEVVFFYKKKSTLDIVFEDENIIVVNKPRKLEVVSDNGGESLLAEVNAYVGKTCYAVHRLDFNTTGLVLFAKNQQAKNSLDWCFKNRTIEKFYLALVCGKTEHDAQTIVAYLKKHNEKSFVEISEKAQNGFVKIETRYKTIEKYKNLSLVEVELVTGKTHQIRAHFAFVGHPVLGDEKYGDARINEKYGLKCQCLCAHKIVFHFDSGDYLNYLDGRMIELDNSKIDFLNKYK